MITTGLPLVEFWEKICPYWSFIWNGGRDVARGAFEKMNNIVKYKKNLIIQTHSFIYITARIKLTLAIFLLLHCHLVQNHSIKLLNSNSSVAIFGVNELDIIDKFPENFQDQILPIDEKINTKQMFDILYIKQSILSSEDWAEIFSDPVKNEIQELVSLVLKKRKEKVLLVIVKWDDPLSPNIKILRTSFYIVGTKDGFAVLFQEIYQNISFPSQYNFEDWIIFRPELIKPIR
ncbi:hypothetical protein P3G55_16775, partial [Leptospira sp. 96542]|nr:hypothetical protein [Leptospira sp. 96542]